jgi:serine/threonine-protein kinase RsbW
MSATPHQETLLLESTLSSVDRAEESATALARSLGMDEDQQHEVGVAVREAMVNAVVHGNKQDTAKRVGFSLAAANGSLTVVVEDEGEGLDLDRVADPTREENLLRPSGRGLLMMRAFVDEFAVERREPRGTRVRMVKHVHAG